MEQDISIINDLLPVLSSSNTGVWVCDTATGELDFRNDFLDMLGLKKLNVDFSTLDGLRGFLHADDAPTFDRAFADASNGKNTNATYRLRVPEGGLLEFESVFMKCGAGVEACTVNKTAMQQAQNWEKQYRTFVNTQFPNFIFVFDENFHYLDVITPDGLRLFHTREELVGQDARQYYSPEVGELLSTNIRNCIKNNVIKEVEHYIELHGTRYFYQARIVPVDGNKAFCLIQDISDRVRRMDELLAQRRRAEESDKMKSALIANMSHEIRTPLNAIVGFSEFLMNELMPEKRHKYMNLIRNNNAQLLQIINDVLDLARLESGMSEFHFEETEVVDLIMGVAETHINTIKPEIRFIPDYPNNNVITLTDLTRVKQVLNNLIQNAIKFTEKGSIILKFEEGDDFLTFSIADTGCGIPADKIKTIFERFEKLNTFTQGTGLGLPICQCIIEQLGGKLTVESELGVGSVFSFTLPYRFAASKRENIGSSREIFANQRKKVMVVETSEEEMLHIDTILSKRYDIVKIGDFEKIVRTFIIDQPNLILMNMEAVSRGEIIKKIRAIAPSIHIIAMTSSDFYHDQRWAIENGCTEAIAKPLPASKLEELVMALIV